MLNTTVVLFLGLGLGLGLGLIKVKMLEELCLLISVPMKICTKFILQVN